MNFPTPNVSESAETALRELALSLARLRKLDHDELAELWPMFAAETAVYTYSTNAIEGSTLTQADTTALLEHGVTAAGKPLSDHLDATNGALAYNAMLETAKSQTPITADIVLDLHRIVQAPIKRTRVNIKLPGISSPVRSTSLQHRTKSKGV